MLLSEETQSRPQVAEKGRLAFVTDCLVMLRYLEIESAIQRAILVLKMRGSARSKQIFRFEIRPAGIKIGEPFEGQQGLLPGLSRQSMISNVH